MPVLTRTRTRSHWRFAEAGVRSDADECGRIATAPRAKARTDLSDVSFWDLCITNGERAKAIEAMDARHEFWQQ